MLRWTLFLAIFLIVPASASTLLYEGIDEAGDETTGTDALDLIAMTIEGTSGEVAIDLEFAAPPSDVTHAYYTVRLRTETHVLRLQYADGALNPAQGQDARYDVWLDSVKPSENSVFLTEDVNVVREGEHILTTFPARLLGFSHFQVESVSWTSQPSAGLGTPVGGASVGLPQAVDEFEDAPIFDLLAAMEQPQPQQMEMAPKEESKDTPIGILGVGVGLLVLASRRT